MVQNVIFAIVFSVNNCPSVILAFFAKKGKVVQMENFQKLPKIEGFLNRQKIFKNGFLS